MVSIILSVVGGIAVGVGLIVVFASMPTLTWFSFQPLQCRIYPWEIQWKESHNGTLDTMPRGITGQMAIIKGYFASKGVHIYQMKYNQEFSGVTCEACSCPSNPTSYYLVTREDAEKMQDAIDAYTAVGG